MPDAPQSVVSVDDRMGSGEVAPILRGLHVPVKVERMDSADFAFEGNGPKGRCLVGIERKKVKELIQSIESGRFEGEQLPKMVKTQQDWLTLEQMQKLLRGCSDVNKPLVALLCETGLRIGEALGLQTGDINGQTLTVRRSIYSGMSH